MSEPVTESPTDQAPPTEPTDQAPSKKPITKQEFLNGVAKIHQEWAKTARVVVDPRYSNNSPSQYAEGIEAVSAIAEDDQVYLDRVQAWMDEWDRSNGRPTRLERAAEAAARAKAKREQEGPPMPTEPTEQPVQASGAKDDLDF